MSIKLFLNAMRIFNKRDKAKIVSISIIQIGLNILDLAGVVLIGLVGALAINGTSSRPPGDRVQTVLNFLNLDKFNLQTQVTYIAVLASLMLVIKTVFSVYFTRKILFFLNNKSALLTKSLVNQIFSGSLIDLNEKSRQENLSIMSGGVASVVNGVIYSFISMVTDISLLAILLIGLFLAEPIISFAALGFFGGTAYVLFLILRYRNLRLNNERFYMTARNNGLILEFLNGFRESVVANRRNFYLGEIGNLQYKLARNTAEMAFLPSISKYIMEIAIVLGSIVIAAIQFTQASVATSVGVLAIFLASSTRMVPAILRIQQSAIQIRGSQDIAEITLERLSMQQVLNESPTLVPKFNDDHGNFYPNIKISNLSFSYPGTDSKLIEDLSLDINFGNVVAIVGPSGSGKSTFVDLLLGLLFPQKGSVTYGSLSPLEAVSAYPGGIAYVPQEIQIINGTLKQNLSLGYDPKDIKNEIFHQAINSSQLTDFLKELPSGLDSQMGEMGSKLSGGQKQRIGIARALITNPRVIVLDEATSALDSETELALKTALMKLRKSATIIIIAHRLSTITESDQIIYFDKNKLISVGSLESIAEKFPTFAKNIRK